MLLTQGQCVISKRFKRLRVCISISNYRSSFGRFIKKIKLRIDGYVFSKSKKTRLPVVVFCP